jgi:hypothetical protein
MRSNTVANRTKTIDLVTARTEIPSKLYSSILNEFYFALFPFCRFDDALCWVNGVSGVVAPVPG